MAMPRSWSPGSYPVRKVTDTKQESGRIVNPPRALVVGGKGNASLIDTERHGRGASKVNAKGPVSDRGKGSKR